MKKKVFSLMMMLLLAFMGVAKAEVVTIGDGTTTTSRTPFNSLWGYSFVEQIFTADEIGTAGTINSISFNMQSTSATTHQVDVFMKAVTRTTFSGTTDYEAVTASDMVFSGTVTFNNGWTTITLDTPFAYDGTSNLMIAMHEYTSGYSTRYFYYTSAADKVISFHSDSYDPDPYNLGSYSGNKYTALERANIQIDITPGGGGGGSIVDNLHIKYVDADGNDVIDRLNLGVRPIEAWTEPFEFTMYSEGGSYTINVLDFTPSDGMFTIGGEELPFVVSTTEDVDLNLTTNGTTAGTIERQFVAITEGDRAAHIWPIVVEMYAPEIPDVVEKNHNFGNVNHTFSYVGIPANLTPTTLHNDYTLPFPEIPEGVDAVYKMTFTEDVMLNAYVSAGNDGKVALYRENFEGEAGPMADNYYQGPIGGAGGSGGSAAGFEAMIGDETSTTTTTYFPFHTLWKYSLSENLFLASELSAAGVTTSPMTSLSWYVSSMTCTTPQNGISIWMANVSDTELTGTSHLTSGMTLVYTGANVLPVAGQWNEFEFNGGNFAWDGHSNVLVVCQRQNGAWQGSISWQTHNPGFTAMSYTYTDTDPGFDATTTTYTMSTSTINRANIVFKSDRSRGMAKLSNPSRHERSAGHPGLRLNPNAASFSPTHNGLQAMLRGSNAYGMQCYGSGATPSMSDGFVNFDVDDFAGTCNLVTSDYYSGGVAYNPNTGNYYIGDFDGYMFYEVDLASGTVVNSISTNYGIISLCYDPATDELYGIDEDMYTFYIVNPASIDYTESYLEDNVNFYYGDELDLYTNEGRVLYDLTVGPDGDLYSVTSSYTSSSEDALLVKVDPYSATTTTMATLNKNCWFLQGFEYDANTGVFVWAQEESAGGSLITIDPSTYAMTTVSTNIGEIMGLCIPAVSGGGSVLPESMSYGPVIAHAAVEAGTYYLVASSTTPDFEVTINAESMPCPGVEGFAFGPTPADDADGIEPGSVTLRWNIPTYATGWRLVFGSTYYPDPTHPQTIMYPEDGTFSNELANSFTVRNLWNNTNYFWHVEFNNDGCPNGVSSPIWGFTTHLNIPTNLQANDYTIFDDETVTLTWNAVVDRTFRTYFIYRDGVKVGETTTNNIGSTTFVDGPLEYNMAGYVYYVTAIYDEGESDPSDPITVKVSGYSNETGINGYAWEQDETTGIPGVLVTLTGTDEFGDPHTYTATTDDNGYYNKRVYAGEYTRAVATKDGYQETETVHPMPFTLAYNTQEDDVNFIIDENFNPVCAVIAEYYPDSLDPESPYVKVYWGCGLPGSNIVEDFETGDFSLFDWQMDATYPWTITTNAPYEGTYCMKSGGAGVANVVSNMTVTVNIPADGLMSFFGKISCESSWDYGYFYIDGVQKGSYTGASNWAEKTFDITAGDHTFQWRYTKDGSVNSNDDCFYVDYITFYKQPAPPVPGMTYDFEDSTMQGWTSVDADGDGYGWRVGSEVMTGVAGHNSSTDFVFSQSYDNTYGILYPDNYLVSPQVQLGGIVRFYACAQDAGYAAEHFGVAVSTTNTQPSSFTMVQEWTMSAKSVAAPAGKPIKGQRSGREQGNWYEYTVDLSAYSGNGYVAIRHFNCSDMFYLDVDDITIGEPGKSIAQNRSLDHYRVYRTNCYNDGPYTEENTVLLATVWVPDTVYIDVEWADLPAGVYKWGVGAVYAGNRGEGEIEGEINWSEPVSINPEMANRDQTIDFEDGQIPTSWVNDATYPWTVVNNAPAGYNGTYCMKSGNGGVASSSSSISATVEYAGAGTVSFMGGCWGEGTSTIWDKCQFYIDGAEQFSNGALQSWGNYSFNVAAGSHTFRWSYTKDSSVNPTVDAFFVDNVVFTTGSGGGGGGGGAGASTLNELALPRESETVWSNCLDKDMYLDHVSVNVLMNSADSPEGTNVTFTNLNEYEQQNYAIAPITLDESGYYLWDNFRKGEYAVKVEHIGYEPIDDTVSIWETTDLRYVMTEIIYGVENLYVSRTGWAMWDPLDPQINGDRHLEYYKVLCTSIDGVPIFNHNTEHPFCQLSTNEPYNAPLVEGEHYLCKVAVVYTTGMGEWCEPVEWEYEPCDHWGPVDEVEVNQNGQGNHIEWVFDHGFNPYGGDTPTPPTPGTGNWYYYDNGINVDAIGLTAGGSFYWGVMFPAGSYEGNMVTKVSMYDYSANTGTILVYQGGTTAPGTLVGQQAYTCTGSEDFVEWEFATPAVIDPTQNLWIVMNNNNGQYVASACDNTGNANGRWISLDGTAWEDVASYGLDYTWMLRAYVASGAKGEPHAISYNGNSSNSGTFAISGNGARIRRGESVHFSMISENALQFNIGEIANYDGRVYFLHRLMSDSRFSVISGEQVGMFIVSSYSVDNLEESFADFAEQTTNSFARMDKYAAADYANEYKGTLPAGFINNLMMDLYIQSRENNMCEFADPFCTDNGMYEFPAGVNAGSGETGPDYDCLYTQPNPAWYYMRIGDPGQMDIHMYSTPEVDIDFCCWGPFDDPTTPCPNGLTEDKVVSCSYSTSWTEHCMIPATAQTGEYYILVITNYSNQTCNINFSMVAGSGSTDCGILPPVDIIGFLITMDGEYLAFAGPTDREFTHEGEFGDHEYCVRPIYPGEMTLPDHNYGWSMGCPVCAETNGEIVCEPGAPIHAELMPGNDDIKVWWGNAPAEPISDWLYYDDGTNEDAIGLQGGGSFYWGIKFPAAAMSQYAGCSVTKIGYFDYTAHTGTVRIYNGSNGDAPGTLIGTYNYTAAGTEDWVEWTIPAVAFDNTQDLWIVMNNADGGYVASVGPYTGDPNGTLISIDGSTWYTLNDATGGELDGTWNLRCYVTNQAKGGEIVALDDELNGTPGGVIGNAGVSKQANAPVYMNRAELVKYNVYRSTEANGTYALIAEVAETGADYYEYIDTPGAAGTYYYQVRAMYSNDCESDPAQAADDPSVNYVFATTDGVGENGGNVALYPNPTKGNVTIEAEGMSRITVVSVLGQVVFDTELDADNYTLNMSQFNAGMYMVRVYTEEGVTVKRVTVMQ